MRPPRAPRRAPPSRPPTRRTLSPEGDHGETGLAPTPAIISVQGVTREFHPGEEAVAGVTLDVQRGEFLGVVGRSGSGKTTLLNMMAGLDSPTSGTVLFEGRDLAGLPERDLVELRRRKIGFVFQSFGLMPLLSAYENVELPLHIGGVPWRERRRRALEALEQVGLGPRARHRPYELSGGEQQRVAVARAMVANPHVVFADEPTGELDSTTAMSIAGLLRDISAGRWVTVVVATHDLALSGMCSRVVEMVDGALASRGEPPPTRERRLAGAGGEVSGG